MGIEEMIAELKETVIKLGYEAVSEALGYPVDENDDIEGMLDEVFDQMPEEEIRQLYKEYCV